MAKLYFRYGTVGSAKTLNLLAVAHNYRQQNKKVVLLKPSIDTRFGVEEIKSRAGLSMKADYLIYPDSDVVEFKQKTTDIDYPTFEGANCIIVDEVQFLRAENIDQLLKVTIVMDIPVICYGLKTDFKGFLFQGSKRLMELADSIEEEKTTCAFCNKKAIFNLKLIDGVAVREGETIDLGTEEKYLPACKKHYYQKLGLIV